MPTPVRGQRSLNIRKSSEAAMLKKNETKVQKGLLDVFSLIHLKAVTTSL